MPEFAVKLNSNRFVIGLGENTVLSARERALAETARIEAAASAAYAESMSGPTYESTATGLAATAEGQGFAVDNGDGTVTVYINNGGSAAEQRQLATTDFLASVNGAGALGFKASGTGAKPRTAEEKFAETVSVGDYDTVAQAVTAAAGKTLKVNPGESSLPAALSPVAGGTLRGDGPATVLKRTVTGNLIAGSDRVGDVISNVTLNLGRSTNGFGGHGISLTGEDLVVENVTARNYGSSGADGGAGVLIGPSATYPTPKRMRLRQSSFFPDASAVISLGWIFDDAVHGIISEIYVEGAKHGIGYGHELKNNAQFNSLDQMIARDCNVAVAYGQQTAGVDGCDYNVATNIVGDACDQLLLISEGIGNVTVGAVHNTDNSPSAVDRRAIQYTGGAQQNYSAGVVTFGTMNRTVYVGGDRNYAQVAAHDTATTMIEFTSGSDKNVIDIAHPGARTTIRASITDNSGFALDSTNANVVICAATGERIGSISGKFWDKLGTSGVIPVSSQNWIYEHGQFVFQTLMTPGNSGDIAGTSVNTARDGNNTARIWHITGPNQAANYWTVGIGGVTDVVRIYNNGIQLGATGPRWQAGAGSPEGVVTAPVGSIYSRTDGGAGTSFYVKQSGVGNTGWVGK